MSNFDEKAYAKCAKLKPSSDRRRLRREPKTTGQSRDCSHGSALETQKRQDGLLDPTDWLEAHTVLTRATAAGKRLGSADNLQDKLHDNRHIILNGVSRG